MVLTAKKEKRSLTDDTVKTTAAKNNSNLFNQTILISLKQKLEQESAKSMFLKEALAAQKQKYQEIHKGIILQAIHVNIFINGILELSNQHLSQVLELENMVKIAQDIAKKEIEKNKESFEKLVLSTNIIEELTSENENLQLQLEILGNE